MTAEEFRKKNRRNMKNPHTRQVKVGRFIVTSHAQNQMVDRGIPNEAMIQNLCHKPEAVSKVTINNKGEPSYDRHNRQTTTEINPVKKTVPTIHVLNKKDARKLGIKREHMKTQAEINKEKRRAAAKKAALTRIKRAAAKKAALPKERKNAKTSKATAKRR